MKHEPSNSSDPLPNLLIVDDRRENLLAMEDLLGDLEAELHFVDSGPEALKICSQVKFALILLDVQMPGMDGFEVAEMLRSVKRTRTTPIIFVTANDHNRTRIIRGYESGAVDFLMKPIVPEILLSKVEVFLEIDRQKSELALLNKQMSEFVAIVSHDLRSPVGTVISFSSPDFLAGCETKQDLLEVFHHVNKAGEDCLKIVADLLDMAAIETGHLNIDRRSFDLGACCGLVVQRLRKRADSKGIKICMDVGEGILVDADEDRIARVLDNLLTNAIKFTRDGGEVQLRTLLLAKSVKVKVEDSGVGIDEADLPKLFAKHLPHSTKGTDGEAGTGFGLPLCQSIVRAHGSGIEVNSRPGEGSEFSFTLDLAKVKVV
jgi:signal transduction histidine kinase